MRRCPPSRISRTGNSCSPSQVGSRTVPPVPVVTVPRRPLRHVHRPVVACYFRRGTHPLTDAQSVRQRRRYRKRSPLEPSDTTGNRKPQSLHPRIRQKQPGVSVRPSRNRGCEPARAIAGLRGQSHDCDGARERPGQLCGCHLRWRSGATVLPMMHARWPGRRNAARPIQGLGKPGLYIRTIRQEFDTPWPPGSMMTIPKKEWGFLFRMWPAWLQGTNSSEPGSAVGVAMSPRQPWILTP